MFSANMLYRGVFKLQVLMVVDMLKICPILQSLEMSVFTINTDRDILLSRY